MALLELTPRGTPQMYYGEEIGMRTTEPKRVEDVRDPIGITGWPKEKGRDGERTPMQWTAAVPNAGFTVPNAAPWLPVPPSARTINVESESANPASLLNFYKVALQLRHTEPALLFGDYVGLNSNDTHVFSFMRRLQPGVPGRNILVALNMSGEKQAVHFNLATQKLAATNASVLQSNYSQAGSAVDLKEVILPPYGAAMFALPH